MNAPSPEDNWGHGRFDTIGGSDTAALERRRKVSNFQDRESNER